MKVHMFKVIRHEESDRLEEVLKAIASDDLGARLRMIGNHEIRVEDIKKTRDGLWLMDFGMLRYEHGPGRAHRARPITGFDFDDGEGFGEETAALFDPAHRCMLVQYNHHGVRSGSIQQYLCQYDASKANLYELAVVYDRETERKLATKTFFSRLSVSMAVSRLSEADRDAGIPLSEAIGIGGEYGARQITLTLSMGQGKHSGLDSGGIKKALRWVKGMLRADDDAITKAEVTCKENADGIAEVLDLVQQRLTLGFDDITIGDDLRFPLDERWERLMRAHRGWSSIIRDL